MPTARKISQDQMAQRAAQEFRGGDVVALGPGLPGLIPSQTPRDSGVVFLADSGVLGFAPGAEGDGRQSGAVDGDGRPVSVQPGGSFLGLAEVAAMLRGGHVNAAVVQAAQVGADGSFTHWTTAALPGLAAPATSIDLAGGSRRVIAMLPHISEDGSPNIVSLCNGPIDGVGCVGAIISDLAVLSVTESGLILSEVAPGWRSDDVVSLTAAPLAVSPGLKEMSFPVSSASQPDKVYATGLEALKDLPGGATVMIDGFAGPGGMPHYLLVSLREHGARDLTIISNTAGIARVVNFGTPPGRMAIDHSILVENGQVKKAIASYPVSPSASNPSSFELAYRRGEVELELVPQGTLAERLRAGGAGIAAFYTPTGVGTLIAAGKETRVIDGKAYILEQGLRADFCLIRGYKADTLGNVVYRGTSRNFNAVMAPAAAVTVVEVDEIVEPGVLDPEEIVTPGVYIQRIVKRPPDFSPYE